MTPLLAGLGDRYSRAVLPPSTVGAAIIGRETFSSSVLNAIQLKQAGLPRGGETAGWNSNGFGEVQFCVLPNSNLVVTYSTRKSHQACPVRLSIRIFRFRLGGQITRPKVMPFSGQLGFPEHRLLHRCARRSRPEDDEILQQRQRDDLAVKAELRRGGRAIGF